VSCFHNFDGLQIILHVEGLSNMQMLAAPEERWRVKIEVEKKKIGVPHGRDYPYRGYSFGLLSLQKGSLV